MQALLHCAHLSSLTISDNPELETLMIWSDDLTHLDLTGCNNIINLKLHCPNLVDQKIPPLKFIEKHIKPSHLPIAGILKVGYPLAPSPSFRMTSRWNAAKTAFVCLV